MEEQYHLIYKNKEYKKGWFTLNDDDVRVILKSFIETRFSHRRSPIFNGYFTTDSNDKFMRDGGNLILASEERDTIECSILDGERFICGSRKFIRVWNLNTYTCERLYGHTDAIVCLSVMGDILCSGSDDYTIRVWNLRTKLCYLILVGHTLYVTRVLICDNKVISASNDKTIKVWNLETGECIHTFKGHENNIRCIRVWENKVISASYDNTLRIWNLKTGVCETILKHNGAISCFTIKDNTLISGSYDKSIKVWNLKSGICEKTLFGHEFVITCLVIKDDLIISGSCDKTLRIWGTGEIIEIKEGDDRVSCLYIDGNDIIVGFYDGSIKIINLLTKECVHTLKDHKNPILNIYVKDSYLISVSNGSTVRIYPKRIGL